MTKKTQKTNQVLKILELRNMSIMELSRQTGLSYRGLYDLAHRDSLGSATYDSVRRISQALDIDVEDLDY